MKTGPDPERGPPRLPAALFIACYFFLLTRASLAVYFSPDDLMNLYRSWSFPLASLVKANFLFFQTSVFYRPMGSVWYRSIFHFAGFHPFPFHLSNLLILFLNLFLTYSVCRRLSDSREIGWLATLLGCYHLSFAPLYFDTGYIYDVLCYCFYFAAFLLYVRLRQSGNLPGLPALAACVVLYICALNSKEMAVTLPLALAVYELLYHPPRWRSAADVRNWIVREGRASLLLGTLTLIFVIGRLSGPQSLASMDVYRPVLTWARFMETSRHFLDTLIRRENWFTSAGVLVLWMVLLAVAWAARSRVLQFCWCFLMLAALPIAFVLPRGAPQHYIPWFGWTLYAAAALVYATRRLLPYRARAAVLFTGIGVLLFWYYRAQGWSSVGSVSHEAPVIRSFVSQMHELHPTVPSGARFLFLNDPVDPMWEDVTFIVRLSYSDDTLRVDRLKTMKQMPDAEKLASYTCVLDYKSGNVFDATPDRPHRTPAIVLNPDGPEVFHQGWAPVTSKHPAVPGELVIAKAIDLGATSPAVPAGQPFPRDPFATLAEPVAVLVNGKVCEPELKIGWPEMVNTYRVDFRIPPGTPPGAVSVQLSAGGWTGPAVRIPVAAR